MAWEVVDGYVGYALNGDGGIVWRNSAKAVTSPKVERKEVEPPEIASVKEILRLAEREGHPLFACLYLIAYTGLRRGEVFNLKWSDINLKAKTLTVTGETAKSGETRHIPLNTEAIDILKNWKAQNKGQERVFYGKDGARLDNIKIAWMGMIADAKVKNFRFHDLRHSFAYNLVMKGAPLNTVRELLGHADLKTTLRYAHLAPDHKAEAVALLNS